MHENGLRRFGKEWVHILRILQSAWCGRTLDSVLQQDKAHADRCDDRCRDWALREPGRAAAPPRPLQLRPSRAQRCGAAAGASQPLIRTDFSQRQSVCGRRRGQIALSTCDSSAQMDLSKHTLTQGMTRSLYSLSPLFIFYRIDQHSVVFEFDPAHSDFARSQK